MLSVAVALLLVAEEPEPTPDTSVDSDSLVLLGVTLGASALGAGLAVGSAVDRDGLGGRVCAISAGTLGLGFAAAAITAGIIALTTRPRSDEGLGAKLIEGTASSIFSSIYGVLAGLAGLVAGAVISTFTSATPGTPRLATGIVGGSAMVVASVGYLIASW